MSDFSEPGHDNDGIRVTLTGPGGETYETSLEKGGEYTDNDKLDCPKSSKTKIEESYN